MAPKKFGDIILYKIKKLVGSASFTLFPILAYFGLKSAFFVKFFLPPRGNKYLVLEKTRKKVFNLSGKKGGGSALS